MMLGRLGLSVKDALSFYAKVVYDVFRDINYFGEPQRKASKIQKLVKSIVTDILGQAEAKMLDETTCKTFVAITR